MQGGPTSEQQFALSEEVFTAIRLVRFGFQALQQLGGENTFRHLPMLTLASGFERLMKTILCLHHLREKGEFPSQKDLKNSGHDLESLLQKITNECFSDTYLQGVPAARVDVEYLRNDPRLLELVRLLSRFGKAARYYHLDVVAGVQVSTDSPDQELQKIEMIVLRSLPGGTDEQFGKAKGDVAALFKVIYREIIAGLERFARALCRLFAIGGLGALAKQQTGVIKDFLFLRDEELGLKLYNV